ncbi:MAG: ParA family protein [Deltaproteobacteria bacterium]|nr:ParA family protein [Deltaproteobacteria bacterium]
MTPSLTRRLKRMAGLENHDRTSSGAMILAVAAQKGGVGKTTTAVNMATAAARYHELRTLLVDLDGQGHVARALASQYENGEPVSLSDILLGHGRDLSEIVHATRIENLYVTPSDKGLAATEGILAGRIGKEFLLRTAMRKARDRFDLIVLDCPPNLGNLTLNALSAADACLVPCDMSVLALSGVADLLTVVETIQERLGHGIRLAGILPTRVDRRNRKVTEAVMSGLEDTYGGLVCATSIPVNSSLARAQMEGVSVFDFDEKSKGALAYRDLTAEVIDKMRSMNPEPGR